VLRLQYLPTALANGRTRVAALDAVGARTLPSMRVRVAQVPMRSVGRTMRLCWSCRRYGGSQVHAALPGRCNTAGVSEQPVIRWTENGKGCVAGWRAENDAPAPKRVLVVADDITADEAYGLACQGTALLWRGDFHNARQMLQALARRAAPKSRGRRQPPASEPVAPAAAFHLYRQAQAQRARTLGALLVPLDEHYEIALRRAPDVRQACSEAYGVAAGASLISLRALLGVIGAHEWRTKGIEIEAIGGRIHPHYGVFAPIRREYVDLVATAPLPAAVARGGTAFDIGTGTGVLAAVLARRGIGRVVATDQDPRALTCAGENLARLGLAEQVALVQADLFPPGRAALVVCNPPWLPARPSSPLERGIFDPENRMLYGFLRALPAHLERQGQGWLILSDLAEHLHLRSRDALLTAFADAQLAVVERHDARPTHPKVRDQSDPLHMARAAEVTSLWRLEVRAAPARSAHT
jgi:SAM-dependent methyltransferase